MSSCHPPHPALRPSSPCLRRRPCRRSCRSATSSPSTSSRSSAIWNAAPSPGRRRRARCRCWEGSAPQDRACLGAILDQPPRLQRLQPCHGRGPSRVLTLGQHVDHLAARHAARARCRAQSCMTSSHRACGSEWVSGSARISNARHCSASPARIAVASSNALDVCLVCHVSGRRCPSAEDHHAPANRHAAFPPRRQPAPRRSR